MSTKAEPLRPSPENGATSTTFDEETTRPVPLELIAQLAAQDPRLELEIGVPEAVPASSSDSKK